jgi:hypothetical protein
MRRGASASERCGSALWRNVLSIVRKSRNSAGGLYRCRRRSAHDRRLANAMRFLMKILRARQASRLIHASLTDQDCRSNSLKAFNTCVIKFNQQSRKRTERLDYHSEARSRMPSCVRTSRFWRHYDLNLRRYPVRTKRAYNRNQDVRPATVQAKHGCCSLRRVRKSKATYLGLAPDGERSLLKRPLPLSRKFHSSASESSWGPGLSPHTPNFFVIAIAR